MVKLSVLRFSYYFINIYAGVDVRECWVIVKEDYMRYQVKWTDSDGVHYGIWRSVKRGTARVADAVLPVYHSVKDSLLVDVEPAMGSYELGVGLVGGDEMARYVDSEYRKAKALSDGLTGIKPGCLFSVGVADGSAWYVVTKVGKASATIGWRGFCPDRYMDRALGAGGSVSLATLKRLGVGRKALFGSFP